MANLPEELKREIEKTLDVIQDLEKGSVRLEVAGEGDSQRGPDVCVTRDKVDDALKRVAEMQLYHGMDTETVLEKYMDKPRRGWLSILDTNLDKTFGRLLPSSVIAVILDSPSGRGFVFTMMAKMSCPFYIISTSMGAVQIDETISSSVLTYAIDHDLKTRLRQSLSIIDRGKFVMPMDKAVVVLMIDSPMVNGKVLNYGMLDEMIRSFTPQNGYLFVVMERRFFQDAVGMSLLSYISMSAVNTMVYREQDGKYIDLSGFNSRKTYHLRITDDNSLRTKALERDFYD